MLKLPLPLAPGTSSVRETLSCQAASKLVDLGMRMGILLDMHENGRVRVGDCRVGVRYP